VIDVVYNHTHATGLSPYSVLDKIVPDYFQRLNIDTGEVETSTCCSNTAAEFRMMEKLIIDSVLLWAEHYKVDSFRFDLMGHHPRYVMENLQQALNELTVEEHGVDGKSIYIYGEGWNFGEVADNRIFDQATQFMTGGMGIGHFNDRIRDAVKGGFYSWTGRDQGFATGKYLFPNEESNASEEEKAALLDQADRIRVGMAGNLSTYRYVNRFGETVDGGNEGFGYTLMPQETVNYLDKHDNETLWDNTQGQAALLVMGDGGAGAGAPAQQRVHQLRAGRAVLPAGLGPASLQIDGPRQLRLGRLVQRHRLHPRNHPVGEGAAASLAKRRQVGCAYEPSCRTRMWTSRQII
jgi:pullulanase